MMGRSKKVRKCPRCGGKDLLLQDTFNDGTNLYVCADCDYEFEIGGNRGRKNNRDIEDEDEFKSEYSNDR